MDEILITDLPEVIYFDERVGTNGIHCLNFENDSDVKYIREDVAKDLIKESFSLKEIEGALQELAKPQYIFDTKTTFKDLLYMQRTLKKR